MADSTQDTLAHRQMVVDYATDFCSSLMDMSEKISPVMADYAADFCDNIMNRAERHDESKLHEPWEAACHRNKNGNIFQSLEKNKDRFKLSDDLCSIFKATADVFEGTDSEDLNLMGLVRAWLYAFSECNGESSVDLYDCLDGVSEQWGFSDQVYHILLNTAKSMNKEESENG